MRAIWNDVVIAESDDTIVVENNHYFPGSSVISEHVRDSPKTTVCPWKGRASYKTIVVNGRENPDAAWYYPAPGPTATQLKDRYAFWRGVIVTP